MPTESVTKLPVGGEEGKGKEKEAMIGEDRSLWLGPPKLC